MATVVRVADFAAFALSCLDADAISDKELTELWREIKGRCPLLALTSDLDVASGPDGAVAAPAGRTIQSAVEQMDRDFPDVLCRDGDAVRRVLARKQLQKWVSANLFTGAYAIVWKQLRMVICEALQRIQPNAPETRHADREPLTTSHQPLATSHQPLATSHQPLATSHQPPTTSH